MSWAPLPRGRIKDSYDGGISPCKSPCPCSQQSSCSASTSGTDAATSGDPGWLEAHAELRDLHVRKSATYGTTADPLANFSESAEILGKPDEYPVLVRMLDKVARAVHMVEMGLANDVKEYPDLASLALCAEALRRRRL